MKPSRCCTKNQRKASRYHNAHKGSYQHFNRPASNMEKDFLFSPSFISKFLSRLFRRKPIVER